MTRIEIVTVALFWDAFGLAIGEQCKGEVMGRVSYAKGGSYDLLMFPAQLCGCLAPEGWREAKADGGGVYYTCQAAQDKEKAVEECLYQVLAALHSAGCMVRLQELPDRMGLRQRFIVHPGEAREKARLAAKAVSRG